jgi:hypothetical protein
MAKAIKEKAPGDMDDVELQQHEANYRKKNEDLEKMKEDRRRKADRMERINPANQDEYVLSVEEVLDIEKDLPEDFTDEDIEKALKKKNIDVEARKVKAKEDRAAFKKQVDEQMKKDAQ